MNAIAKPYAALALVAALTAAPALAREAAPSPSPNPSVTSTAPATGVSPAPAALPSPSDAAMLARAKSWLQQLQAGKIDRSQLTPKVNALLTDALVAQVSSQLAPLGTPSSFTLAEKQKTPAGLAYVYLLKFAPGNLHEILVIDNGGKIAGLFFKPAL